MSTEAAYKPRWLELIAAVRSRFSGEVGYNAGGLIGPFPTSQEYRNVTFTGALDFLGISAYPRLSAKRDADADDYRKGWTQNAYGNNSLKQLNDFLEATDKDVYLTELGSPATRGGAFFLNRPRAASATYDLDQQAAFFDASLEVPATATEGRLEGIYI